VELFVVELPAAKGLRMKFVGGRLTAVLITALLASCGGSTAPEDEAQTLAAQPDDAAAAAAETDSMPAAQARSLEPALAAPSAAAALPAGQMAWSDPKTWGGQLPGPDAKVVVPAGRTLVLDTDVTVKNLTIRGTLLCSPNRAFTVLQTDWIMVMGAGSKLQCGSESQRYAHRIRFNLVGKAPEDAFGMGTRFLGASDGGVIELHGHDRTSWTKLGATAQAGSTTLQLSQAPKGWAKGYPIVVGSSTEDPRQAEVRTIAAVNGNQVTLDAPLTYNHFGTQQAYSNGKQTWTVDTRAPVGLLSRSINIRGPEDASATGFGAHVMIMAGAQARFTDVAFVRAGQKSIKGRYPFHWHLVGDGKGQYVKNSVINESYNRCYTVHGTDNTELSNNVCYNHIGHGYFLEDGVEQGNVIKGNLGILSVKPKAGENILSSDVTVNPAAAGPATFWISNPKNTVVGNHAGGGDGTGFWFFLEDKDLPRYDGTTTKPRTTNLTAFDNNIASSSEMGYVSCPESGGQRGFESPERPQIDNFTAFMTSRSGAWPCGLRPQRFDQLKLVDSGHKNFKAAFTAPNDMEVTNSLFVANSGLASMAGKKEGRAAVGLYDQGFYIHDSHFIGYTKADNSALFGFAGGAVKNYHNRVERVTFEPQQFAAYQEISSSAKSSVDIGSVVHDVDGSFGLGPNRVLAPDSQLLEGLGCAKSGGLMEGNSFGTLCPAHVVRVRVMLKEGTDTVGPFEMFHVKGGTEIKQQFDTSGVYYYQAFLMPNQASHFGVKFSKAPTEDFNVLVLRGWPGDVVRYELRGVSANTVLKNSSFAQVNSLAALESATGSAWYKSGTTVHVKFKLPADKPQWDSSTVLSFGV
jgi:G8 domain